MFLRAFCCLMAFLLSACTGSGGVIKGSGKIIQENRPVTSFSQIVMAGVGTLLLSQGEQHQVVVETDDNLQEYIRTEIKNDTLYIEILKNAALSPSKEIKYFVFIPNLAKIDLAGAVTVRSSQFLAFRHLEINLSGAGNLDLTVATDSLRVNLSGSGDIQLAGQSKVQEVDVSGAGSYKGFSLESTTAHVVVSGVGNAEVNVLKNLEVDISGVGSVIYQGNPTLRQKISGVGSIRHYEESKEVQ